jgi:predicted metal-dependent hydrolase
MELTYDLVRSKKRKKTISLHVKKDGSIVIQAPFSMPGRDINRFFKGKTDWLFRKIEEREKRPNPHMARSFASGETFLLLGVPCPLMIQDKPDGNGHLTFSRGQFVMETEQACKGRELFTTWYKNKAKALMEERIRHYSGMIGLYPDRLRISNARFRWGSCSRDNSLSFSWRLAMAPSLIIDYVVVHELAHIKEKNHSRSFWALVETMMPDYRKHRHWLKENGHLLDI